jgi:quercetin dioxygenase-like cupin family protein|tara:strand:+ start:71 stop:547 length:477 start_codon:yes stop_codon:yes gene_type:complete
MSKLKQRTSQELSVANFRNQVINLENELLAVEHDCVVKGNSDAFPLTHSFSEGVYVREMKMHKGGIVIGKIHNRSHTWFLMKGHLQVATENGTFEYKAPTYVNADAGAKRVIKALENSVFINVHPNPNNITDTNQLERILTCSSYEEYENMNNKNILI